MIRRLICRFFGHRIESTPIARGKVKGTAIGCGRCDTFFGIETASLPAMSVPRGR